MLEQAASQDIHDLKLETHKASGFAQKLATLRKSAKKYKHPQRLCDLLDAITPLLALRADIIHSKMEVVEVCGSSPKAHWLMFQNNHLVPDTIFDRKVMLPADIKALSAKVKSLAKQLTDQKITAPAPAQSAASTGPASAS